MKRHTPPIGGKHKKLPLQLQIAKQHKFVELHVDFFFVNKLPFLHTKSVVIQFLSVELVKNRKAHNIINGLDTVQQIYHSRGFKLTIVHADGEFNIDTVRTVLLPAQLTIYAKNEHVSIVERSIITFKERCRCNCHSVPFLRYTKL